MVKIEPMNRHNIHAVTITDRDTEIVGHVPYNLVPRMSAFLMRDMDKAFTEITGAKVNREAGYDLEVPSIWT